jgi:hypothetical protein
MYKFPINAGAVYHIRSYTQVVGSLSDIISIRVTHWAKKRALHKFIYAYGNGF